LFSWVLGVEYWVLMACFGY
jgi:hypothetical protein